MSILCEPMRITNIELRNRFVRSATYEGCTDKNGLVSEKQIRLYEELAGGGVGLVVTGIAYVHSFGQLSPFQNSIADDGCIPVLARWGFDALEISQGLRGEWCEGTEFRTKISSVDREGYFRDWCKRVKSEVSVPVMMVGGLRTFELMEEVIQKGEADFISLCRPLIREPGMVNGWKGGQRHRATCISCNMCLGVIGKGEILHCAQQKSEEKS